MNWFERHLNWTYILGHVAYLLAMIVFWFLLALCGIDTDNFTMDAVGEVVAYLLYPIILVPLALWILRQKGQSLWWVLLFGWLSPIWLKNKCNI